MVGAHPPKPGQDRSVLLPSHARQGTGSSDRRAAYRCWATRDSRPLDVGLHPRHRRSGPAPPVPARGGRAHCAGRRGDPGRGGTPRPGDRTVPGRAGSRGRLHDHDGSRGRGRAARTKPCKKRDDDVVLLAGHAVVFEGWLERMAAAGRSDTTVATAGALGNNAGILSVGAPGDPLPPDANPQKLAAQLAAQSQGAYPRIPMADGHCVWISRSALELVGPLDPDLRSVRAAVIDFSQRCLLRGLVNVAAEVFVASVHPDAAATGGALDVGEDRQALLRRYPYLRHAVEVDVAPGLSETLSAARRALHGLSVTIDARILRGTSSGAHAQTLELIETLARTGGPRVRVLLDPAIGPEALAVLDRLPEVERLFAPDLPEDLARSDIVHRPYQVTSAADLELLPRLGDRIVITHLDLIAFHNPGYFASFGEWQQYRRVTRQALAMADQAIFLSDHARVDALREGLVEADLARVIPMAVRREKGPVAARRPAEAPAGTVPAGDRERLPPQEPPLRDQAAGRAARAWVGRAPRARRRERRVRVLARRRGGVPCSTTRVGESGARPAGCRRGREGMALHECRCGRLSDRLRGLRPDPVRGGAGGNAVPVRAAGVTGGSAARGGSRPRSMEPR